MPVTKRTSNLITAIAIARRRRSERGVWPRNRLAFVGAGAAVARVQVAALFKLIELGLRHQNRPPEEAALAALAMPGDRLADLFSAVGELFTDRRIKITTRQAS